MGRLALLSDEELEELLAGGPLEGQPDLDLLADVAAAVRSRARAEPAPVMGYELRRALYAAPAPRRTRRRLLDGVAAVAAVVTLGAVSAAGALPAPFQDAVSDAGGLVGISVPSAEPAVDAPGRELVAARLGEPEDEGTEPKATATPDGLPGGADAGDPRTRDERAPATSADEPDGEGDDPTRSQADGRLDAPSGPGPRPEDPAADDAPDAGAPGDADAPADETAGTDNATAAEGNADANPGADDRPTRPAPGMRG
jgi:hypothetical protein